MVQIGTRISRRLPSSQEQTQICGTDSDAIFTFRRAVDVAVALSREAPTRRSAQ